MGDHGLFLKGFMHYQGTLRVPLVISAPGAEAQVNRALVSSTDICPTLLDLCEIPSYDGIQGKSLGPLLSGSENAVRDHILIEDDIATITSTLTPIPAKTRTIVSSDQRYTRNSKGEEQLFNLENDPHEMQDLKKRDPHLRSLIIEKLMDALIETDDSAKGAPNNGADEA